MLDPLNRLRPRLLASTVRDALRDRRIVDVPRPGDLAFGQAMALSVILMVITASAVLIIERFRGVVAGEL